MTDNEMRKLDAWIGVNVFGKKAIHRDGPKPSKGTEDDYFITEYVNISYSLPYYTTDPAAAMRVLEKCVEKLDQHKDGNLTTISVRGGSGKWRFGSMVNYADANTLPLAICLFAEKLFSK